MPGIAAVVPAAGRSTRFATASAPDAFKLVAPFHGRPLVRATVECLLAAERFDPVVVVLGHRAPEVRAALSGLPVTFAENPRFAEGIGTSIAAGVAALPPATGAALVALADQPLTDPTIVRRVVARYRRGDAPIVRPRYAGTPGNPVLFDAAFFHALRRLGGDEGARALLRTLGDDVVHLDFTFAAPPDFDTPFAMEPSDGW